nr:MAG TPA: hypothetical protein [Caudoviricetes sp.]
MVRYRSLLSLAKVIISECFCGIVATFSGYYVKGICRHGHVVMTFGYGALCNLNNKAINQE